MRRINYPSIPLKLTEFENEFLAIFSSVNIAEIDKHLSKIQFPKGKITFNEFIILKFEELIELEQLITNYSKPLNRFVTKKKIKKNAFDDLFNYKITQKKIANFFMKQSSFKIKTCYYCGIDYINSFSDSNDYFDGVDFINRASLKELQTIYGIGPKIAQEIINQRNTKQFKSVGDLKLNHNIVSQINLLDSQNGHNHFTLDHVIPQKTHRFYSLCLYNLVPSCYSCNSKFKKDKPFLLNSDLQKISPTSLNYSLTNDFQFKIYYPNKLNDVKTNKDFILKKTIKRNRMQIESYLSLFKIDGRYIYHKDLITDLIKLKIDYPYSRIKELSQKFGKNEKEIMSNIFGDELFDVKKTDLPLVKFKRDIAKKINIKGVL